MSSQSVKTFKYANIRGYEDDPYKLKRPNVFVGTGSEGVLQVGDQILGINNQPTKDLTHAEAQNIFKTSGTSATLDISRLGPAPSQSEMNVNGESEQAQAKNVLTTHLKSLIDSDPTANNSHLKQQSPQVAFYARPLPQAKPVQNPGLLTTNQKLASPKSANGSGQQMYCPIILDNQPASPRGRDAYNTVPLENQPYRTLPLVLPNPKTIHDIGEMDRKYVNPNHQETKEQPYRSASVLLPGPRTINEVGIGAPMYQPMRGPQYDTHISKQMSGQMYNNPRPLYSEDNLADIPANAGFVQNTILHLPSGDNATQSHPHESETFKIVLESEMDSATNQSGITGKNFEKNCGPAVGSSRPASQLSDRSNKQYEVGGKNNNISQSASFKKLMYSVLGETEF